MVRVLTWLLVFNFLRFLSFPGASVLCICSLLFVTAIELGEDFSIFDAGDVIEIFESGLRLDLLETSDIGLGAGTKGTCVDVDEVAVVNVIFPDGFSYNNIVHIT